MPIFLCYGYPPEYSSENGMLFNTVLLTSHMLRMWLIPDYFTVELKNYNKFQKSKLDSIKVRFTDKKNTNSSSTKAFIGDDNIILYTIHITYNNWELT